MQIAAIHLCLVFASLGLATPMHIHLPHKTSTTTQLELSSNASAPLVTNLTTGVSYQGTSQYGVDQFQNIFFGQPTSGERRFAPPLAYVPAANTTINATAPGAACPQPFVPTPGLPLFSNVTNISEDCLNLRIARPEKTQSSDSLPVMVWIYGGVYIVSVSQIVLN